MKGCGIVILIVVLLGTMLISWLFIKKNRIQKSDLPIIELKTQIFLNRFNSENFDEIDEMLSLAFLKIYTKNQRMLLIQNSKNLVGGKVAIVRVLSWKLNQIAGQKFILIAYACNSEKGETKLTIKYNWENEWKIEAIEFKMKN